jgi:hypothetical protein
VDIVLSVFFVELARTRVISVCRNYVLIFFAFNFASGTFGSGSEAAESINQLVSSEGM